MISPRLAGALFILTAGHVLGTADSWAADPVTEEMALRECWVGGHFPTVEWTLSFKSPIIAAMLCCATGATTARSAQPQDVMDTSSFPTPVFRHQPQWRTGPRLLKLGETIDFEFFVPPDVWAGDVRVFPQYLEHAQPASFSPTTGDLGWVQQLEHEDIKLTFSDGRASASYRPRAPGSYLAQWQAGDETLYRYFSAIEDRSIVLRMSTFVDLEAEPTLHATGIPLDYRLPVERFDPHDPLYGKFLEYHRVFGDAIVPHLPDTPQQTPDERLQQYGEALRRARSLMPDARDVRSARVEMHHDLDPGYTRAFMQLDVNDHCGLNEANAQPWLGMPEFPYFASPIDCRKMNQDTGGSVLAHQWDFCGGWHFLGPVSWHYKASSGDWSQAERCVCSGVAELENLAELSGHPAFAVPLYDGLVGSGYPNPAFVYGVGQPRNFRGLVDDAFVSDRALSQSDIVRMMREGAASPETPGLVWSFDEGQGELVRDRSGNNHDGHFVGQPSWVAGPFGTAISLDGERDSLVADAPVPVRNDFTIGCWVNPARFQRSYANLLSSHNDDQGHNHRGVSLEQDGDNINRFYLIAGNAAQWLGTTATTQLTPDVWQHFAVVRQGEKLTHYLNGVVSTETHVPAGPLAPATDPWRVGDWARGHRGDASDMLAFVERYQRFMAFELPKQHRVAYARSVDIADYYRRHFQRTPRTVFVSKTDHPLYDMWWLCTWCADGILVPRATIPWDTKVSSVFRVRDTVQPFKDPLSHEYILIEDQQRQMRFERECPNPIWWFDYARQETGPEGSSITYTRTPDVVVRRSAWVRDGDRLTMHLKISSPAEIPDYALCIWAVPTAFSADRATVQTNAKDFIPVKNTDGEFHLVLVFDLQREMELRVSVHSPGTRDDPSSRSESMDR